jgi:hypothetical protein
LHAEINGLAGKIGHFRIVNFSGTGGRAHRPIFELLHNEADSGREHFMKQIEVFQVLGTPCPCMERLAGNKKRGAVVAPLF